MPINGVEIFKPLAPENTNPVEVESAFRRIALEDEADGYELKRPSELMELGFQPEWLADKPYSMHMENPVLTNLYHNCENLESNDRFWNTMEWILSLYPMPETVVFHGPRAQTTTRPLDESRYENQVSDLVMSDLRNFTIKVFDKLMEMEIPAHLENLSPTEFAGPPSIPVWTPITYLVHQVGTSMDEIYKYETRHAMGICLDIDHLRFARQFEERGGGDNPPVTKETTCEDFLNTYINKKFFCSYVHLSGSTQGIIERCAGEPEPPDEYFKILAKSGRFTDDQLDFCRRYRVNSHAIIPEKEPSFHRLVKTLVENDIKTIVIETAKHTPNDCYYWMPKDGPEQSFRNLKWYLENVWI